MLTRSCAGSTTSDATAIKHLGLTSVSGWGACEIDDVCHDARLKDLHELYRRDRLCLVTLNCPELITFELLPCPTQLALGWTSLHSKVSVWPKQAQLVLFKAQHSKPQYMTTAAAVKASGGAIGGR